MTNEHTLSSGRREGGQNSGWTGILTDSSTAGRGGNTTSGTSSKGGAPSFSTELLKYSPPTLDSIVWPVVGAELHPPQEVRPIGHPAPRSCRGNDACATGRPLQTSYLFQVLAFAKQSLETDAAICTLQVIWSQCPRRTPPTRSAQGAGWELYRYACAQQVFSERALE